MHNLSMRQALGVWSDLEAAYYQQGGLGYDTAEIYAYRLLPRDLLYDEGIQLLQQGKTDTLYTPAAMERLKEMATSLRQLVLLFETEHQVRVMVVEARKDVMPARNWLAAKTFFHRIHLRVVREDAEDDDGLSDVADLEDATPEQLRATVAHLREVCGRLDRKRKEANKRAHAAEDRLAQATSGQADAAVAPCQTEPER